MNSFLMGFIQCLLILMLFHSVESVEIDWKSSMNLSAPSLFFVPMNNQYQFLSSLIARSLIFCAQFCHSNDRCRIFDYDRSTERCRLFEGDIITMGQLMTSSSSLSRVGSIQFFPQQYFNYGQSCSMCQGSRYLRCVNNTCQCPMNTFFDGSICQSQKFLGQQCFNTTECRTDLNYTCLMNLQCGFVPQPSLSIVGGYGNGTSGNSLNALSQPLAIVVAVDNSIYVSDYGNHRVMRIPNGSLVGSIVAGTGMAGSANNRLYCPTGIFVDSSLNVYVVDSLNYRIMLWLSNATTGIRVAGTGSAGSSLNTFSVGSAIYVDTQKNIYLSDSNNHRIMRWTPNASLATFVAGTGVAGSGPTQLNSPYGIDLDEMNSYLYVVDYNNHRIQRFQLNISTIGVTIAGGNGAGSASNQLYNPYSLYVSRLSNTIFIGDGGNNRIQFWNIGSTNGTTFVGLNSYISLYAMSLQSPMDLRLNSDNTFLFVSEMLKNRVWRFRVV